MKSLCRHLQHTLERIDHEQFLLDLKRRFDWSKQQEIAKNEEEINKKQEGLCLHVLALTESLNDGS